MSAESIKLILSRAIAEPEFRSLLLREPDQAIAGYGLTDAEIAVFQNLKLESFDAMAADLGARMSQVVIALPTLQADGTIKDEGIASEIVLAH